MNRPNPTVTPNDELRLLSDIFRIRARERQNGGLPLARLREMPVLGTGRDHLREDGLPFGSNVIFVRQRDLTPSAIYAEIRRQGMAEDLRRYIAGRSSGLGRTYVRSGMFRLRANNGALDEATSFEIMDPRVRNGRRPAWDRLDYYIRGETGNESDPEAVEF